MDNVNITEHWLSISDTLPLSGISVVDSARVQARSLLSERPLPLSGSEHYKRFDIDAFLSYPWQVDAFVDKGASRLSLELLPCQTMATDAIQCRLNSHHVLVADDASATGVFIGSLTRFAQEYPEKAEMYYNKMTSVGTDALSALNTLFVKEVLVIFATKGVQEERPIHLVQYFGKDEDTEWMTFPRILVVAEEASSLKLLACDHANPHAKSGRNSVLEIYAEEGSSVEYYDVEESGSLTDRVHNVHVRSKENSNVLVQSITVQNGKTRNNFFCDLVGEGASLDIDGLCILDGEQLADNWSEIRHSVPNCQSDELFKYTVNDHAIGSFSGKIYVAKDAQKTLAYQNNRNLVLAKSGKMFSKPQLEIYADDVKCSHGMTTGELSEEALFYMQQRGIPQLEARLQLTIAFMYDVLDKIRLDSLRKRLLDVVADRFRGIPSYCQE